MWLTPASGALPVPPPGYITTICVSASQVADGAHRRAGGFAYIQGSGDDHELWGEVGFFPFHYSFIHQPLQGLTPALFWRHRKTLLEAERAELPALVARLVADSVRAHDADKCAPTPISRVHGRLLVCAVVDLPETWNQDTDTDTAYVVVAGVGTGTAEVSIPDGVPVLRIEAWAGKKGQFQFLQDILPRATAFFRAQLKAGRLVCAACDSGADFSVGIALAALQLFFDDAGELVGLDGDTNQTGMLCRAF
jgi:tRNA A64-2'-O-ribosylphosphate transferase